MTNADPEKPSAFIPAQAEPPRAAVPRVERTAADVAADTEQYVAADTSPDGDGTSPVPLSRWARVALGAMTVLIGGAVAVHLAVMFLGAAPENTVSHRYARQIAAWSEPWLEQNWKLFAPNPLSENVSVRARARMVTGAVGPWVDLSAADDAATLHDPMPDHVTQNQLRNLWFDYLDDVPASGEPTTTDGTLMREQLCRAVLHRLDTHVSGPVAAVMVQATTTQLPAPDAPATTAPRPTVQTLPWWPTASVCTAGGAR